MSNKFLISLFFDNGFFSPRLRCYDAPLQKSLFAVDELTGIIHAYSLMRPEGMEGMEVKSLKKKFKDKKFAAKCNREIIKNGVADLGMDLGDVMACCIKGMNEHKAEFV